MASASSSQTSTQALQRARALVSQLTAAPTAAHSHNKPTAFEGEYKYSLDPKGLLTPEQRKQYDEQGFILIKKLLPESDIAKWHDRFIGIANGDIPPTPTMTVMRDVAIAKKKEKGEKAITKLQDWQVR